jgi:predicted metal-dependent HD superfamily phosphohydrolase
MPSPEWMTVVRCPVCGSTRAGEDEGTSAGYPAGTYAMECASCGHTAVCDEYDIKFDWNAYVSKGPLPAYVVPTDSLDAAVSKLCGARQGAHTSAQHSIRTRAIEAWSEPHRRYHTLEHLSECLVLFRESEVRRECERPHEVMVALWLHDLVYDTARTDNEERSAEEARKLLSAAGVAEEAVERIAALILATKHHVAETPDAAVLLDVDLAILGAGPERFARYEAQIREEYGWVPDEAYRAGRRAVLERFAGRPRIFLTNTLHDRLEARARANLAAALA